MQCNNRGLKICDEEVNDTFSKFIAYLAASKLDRKTFDDWENTNTDVEVTPTFDQLKAFLKSRSFALMSADKKTQKPTENKIENNEKSQQPSSRDCKSFIALRLRLHRKQHRNTQQCLQH